MTISVHYATSLPKNHSLATHAPPIGFPMVVVEEAGKVIESVFLFLAAKHLNRGPRRWKKHTAKAHAFDLRDWFDYLSHVEWKDPLSKKTIIGKPWDVATEADYISWVDTMHAIISPKTGRPLVDSTIKRMQTTVGMFYKYATGAGWYKGSFLKSKLKKGRLAEFIVSAEITSSEVASYRRIDDDRRLVNPLTPLEWGAIRAKLGRLPSEIKFNFDFSRDRLACELSVVAGMRVDEVAGLTDLQILNLYNDWSRADKDERDFSHFKLPLTHTKFLRPRYVLVPGYLIQELMTYFEGERAASVCARKNYCEIKGTKFKNSSSFFLNHVNAGANAGNPIQPETLSLAFKKACESAGITVIIEKIDIETGNIFHVTIAAHTYHDLRHTFSVWKYEALIDQGVVEPWKEIQTLLGHKYLKTTIDTYLAVVSIDRQRAGKRQFQAKRDMGMKNA